MINFTLPFPPSVNEYYRATNRGKFSSNIKSKKAREYPALVKRAIGFWPHEPITGPLAVCVTLTMPDRRRRDIDNYLKGLFDAMTVCGVWADDEQVIQLSVDKIKSDDIPKERRGLAIISIHEVHEPLIMEDER